ncbi:MAG: hypothetical protein K2X81_22940, partial [Candidatus Obscuribacterales bacterium]|nr:hypothetical protein [Candidatus Obscuribacterales bacterium]
SFLTLATFWGTTQISGHDQRQISLLTATVRSGKAKSARIGLFAHPVSSRFRRVANQGSIFIYKDYYV